MQLYVLRRMLNEYENSWSLRKLFMKEDHEVGLVRQFMQRYESKPDDYTLSISDQYSLVKIILAGRNNQLTVSLSNLFNENYLLGICGAIDKAGLLSEATFKRIYHLTHEPRSLLRSLFCTSDDHPVPLNPEILDAVLKIANSGDLSGKAVESCIRFLNNAGCLNVASLNLILQRMQQIHSLFNVLKEMQAANCMNDANIAALNTFNQVSTIANILKNLRIANVHVNDDLMRSIYANKYLHFLIETTSILIDANPELLTLEIFSTLLQREIGFFIRVNPTLKLFQQNEILDQQTLRDVFDNDTYHLHTIIEILASGGLLKSNRDLISKVTRDEIDAISLDHILRYLSVAKLLDQDALNACVNQLLQHAKETFSDNNFLKLFEIFTQEKFYISKDTLLLLLGLPTLTFDRIYDIIVLSAKIHQLDQKTIENAMERVAVKLPVVTESVADKRRRKESGEPRSEIILNHDVRFFAEHSEHYIQGGLGIIKKGYETALADKPVYAMKLPIRPGTDDIKKGMRREAKYHRLLGRDAFYFTNRKNNPCLVTPWFNGKDLHSHQKSELLQAPIEVRLRCLASGLSDLNTLHQYYRVHGDIKSLNFILDLNNAAMKLIDFGTSRKLGSKRTVGWSSAYIDKYSFVDSVSRDLYAMGIVTMEMFPELYKVDINGTLSYSRVKSECTVEEQAVVNLVDSMMNSRPSIRCTSREALSYCNNLIESQGQLNLDQLKSIADATIHSIEPAMEDAFRGCNKPGRKG